MKKINSFMSKIIAIILVMTFVAPMVPAQAAIETLSSGSGSLFIDDGRIGVHLAENGRFGIRTTGGLPGAFGDANKNMTFNAQNPETSFTTFKINGRDYIFGGQYGSNGALPVISRDGLTVTAAWQVEGVEIRQLVSLTLDGATTGNATISYHVTNNSGAEVEIGSRILLDTVLGTTPSGQIQVDGSSVVGAETTFWNPTQWYIADHERAPTIAGYGMLRGLGSRDPDRFVVAHYEGIGSTAFDYEPDQRRMLGNSNNRFGTNDTAVAIYWEPATVRAGETVIYETIYGLGTDSAELSSADFVNVTIHAADEFALTSDGTGYQDFIIRMDIRNLTSIHDPNPVNMRSLRDISVVLDLEDSWGRLQLAFGETATRTLNILGPGTVETLTWRVNARPDHYFMSYDYVIKLTYTPIITISGAPLRIDRTDSFKREVLVPAVWGDPPEMQVFGIVDDKIYFDEKSGNHARVDVRGDGFSRLYNPNSKWEMTLRRVSYDNSEKNHLGLDFGPPVLLVESENYHPMRDPVLSFSDRRLKINVTAKHFNDANNHNNQPREPRREYHRITFRYWEGGDKTAAPDEYEFLFEITNDINYKQYATGMLVVVKDDGMYNQRYNLKDYNVVGGSGSFDFAGLRGGQKAWEYRVFHGADEKEVLEAIKEANLRQYRPVSDGGAGAAFPRTLNEMRDNDIVLMTIVGVITYRVDPNTGVYLGNPGQLVYSVHEGIINDMVEYKPPVRRNSLHVDEDDIMLEIAEFHPYGVYSQEKGSGWEGGPGSVRIRGWGSVHLPDYNLYMGFMRMDFDAGWNYTLDPLNDPAGGHSPYEPETDVKENHGITEYQWTGQGLGNDSNELRIISNSKRVQKLPVDFRFSTRSIREENDMRDVRNDRHYFFSDGIFYVRTTGIYLCRTKGYNMMWDNDGLVKAPHSYVDVKGKCQLLAPFVYDKRDWTIAFMNGTAMEIPILWHDNRELGVLDFDPANVTLDIQSARYIKITEPNGKYSMKLMGFIIQAEINILKFGGGNNPGFGIGGYFHFNSFETTFEIAGFLNITPLAGLGGRANITFGLIDFFPNTLRALGFPPQLRVLPIMDSALVYADLGPIGNALSIIPKAPIANIESGGLSVYGIRNTLVGNWDYIPPLGATGKVGFSIAKMLKFLPVELNIGLRETSFYVRNVNFGPPGLKIHPTDALGGDGGFPPIPLYVTLAKDCGGGYRFNDSSGIGELYYGGKLMVGLQDVYILKGEKAVTARFSLRDSKEYGLFGPIYFSGFADASITIPIWDLKLLGVRANLSSQGISAGADIAGIPAEVKHLWLNNKIQLRWGALRHNIELPFTSYVDDSGNVIKALGADIDILNMFDDYGVFSELTTEAYNELYPDDGLNTDAGNVPVSEIGGNITTVAISRRDRPLTREEMPAPVPEGFMPYSMAAPFSQAIAATDVIVSNTDWTEHVFTAPVTQDNAVIRITYEGSEYKDLITKENFLSQIELIGPGGPVTLTNGVSGNTLFILQDQEAYDKYYQKFDDDDNPILDESGNPVYLSYYDVTGLEYDGFEFGKIGGLPTQSGLEERHILICLSGIVNAGDPYTVKTPVAPTLVEFMNAANLTGLENVRATVQPDGQSVVVGWDVINAKGGETVEIMLVKGSVTDFSVKSGFSLEEDGKDLELFLLAEDIDATARSARVTLPGDFESGAYSLRVILIDSDGIVSAAENTNVFTYTNKDQMPAPANVTLGYGTNGYMKAAWDAVRSNDTRIPVDHPLGRPTGYVVEIYERQPDGTYKHIVEFDSIVPGDLFDHNERFEILIGGELDARTFDFGGLEENAPMVGSAFGLDPEHDYSIQNLIRIEPGKTYTVKVYAFNELSGAPLYSEPGTSNPYLLANPQYPNLSLTLSDPAAVSAMRGFSSLSSGPAPLPSKTLRIAGLPQQAPAANNGPGIISAFQDIGAGNQNSGINFYQSNGIGTTLVTGFNEFETHYMTNKDTVLLTIVSDVELASLEVFLNNAEIPLAPGQRTLTLSGLTDGKHVIDVTATGINGDVSYEVIKFTVHTTPPELRIVEDDDGRLLIYVMGNCSVWADGVLLGREVVRVVDTDGVASSQIDHDAPFVIQPDMTGKLRSSVLIRVVDEYGNVTETVKNIFNTSASRFVKAELIPNSKNNNTVKVDPGGSIRLKFVAYDSDGNEYELPPEEVTWGFLGKNGGAGTEILPASMLGWLHDDGTFVAGNDYGVVPIIASFDIGAGYQFQDALMLHIGDPGAIPPPPPEPPGGGTQTPPGSGTGTMTQLPAITVEAQQPSEEETQKASDAAEAFADNVAGVTGGVVNQTGTAILVVLPESRPTVVTIINLPEGVDTADITIMARLNPDGSLTPVPTRIVDGELIVLIDDDAILVPLSAFVTFTDIGNLTRHVREEIIKAASMKIVFGLPDNTFRPNDPVTVQQAVTMFLRSKGIPVEWETAMITGLEYGFISSDMNAGTPMTRIQTAQMIVNVLRYFGLVYGLTAEEIDELLKPFADVGGLTGAERRSLAVTVKLGIFRGTGDGMMRPEDIITRSQMASLAIRLQYVLMGI